MSFAEPRGRLVDAIFARFGEDSTWTGISGPVRVVPREEDGEAQLGQASQIVKLKFLRVRKAEVPGPVRGDIAALASGISYKVIADPELDRRGIWHCQVSEIIGP